MSGQPWLRQRCAERVGAFHIEHDLQLSSSWTAVFGPSGTGKSTWLRMLAGLVPQRTGSLLLRGKEIRTIPPHQRRIALVEQAPALFPHRTVEGNVGFACHAGAESHDVRDALLDEFRLLPIRRADVRTISGGERQRVAIARALCADPAALLLDEVFTGMDAALRTELVTAIQRWQTNLKLPILSVTHDVSEVLATADEVLRMHDGRITAQGPPKEALHAERTALLQSLAPEP